MSYLSSYATRNPRARGAGVDEKLRLNLPGFHGDAYVRVFVEDTTFRKWRRRPPEPRIRLQPVDRTALQRGEVEPSHDALFWRGQPEGKTVGSEVPIHLVPEVALAHLAVGHPVRFAHREQHRPPKRSVT